jgi:hypothetical protein
VTAKYDAARHGGEPGAQVLDGPQRPRKCPQQGFLGNILGAILTSNKTASELVHPAGLGEQAFGLVRMWRHDG